MSELKVYRGLWSMKGEKKFMQSNDPMKSCLFLVDVWDKSIHFVLY